MTGDLWPDEAVEQLRTLRRQGLSASQIGAKMGKSRNAIIAKLHRLGLTKERDTLGRLIVQEGSAMALSAPDTDEGDCEVTNLTLRGHSPHDIAMMTGLPINEVTEIAEACRYLDQAIRERYSDAA